MLTYIAFCLLVCVLAHNKKRSTAKAFLVSFFFSPIIGLIVVALLHDYSKGFPCEQYINNCTENSSVAQKIRNLRLLLEEGILTVDEYERQLSRLRKKYYSNL